jgi:probable biosynthetic protein (TIGR04099 family)
VVPALPLAPRRAEPVYLGMMQLGPDGLSEQWLLRDGGDRHWALIAEAMGQDRAVFCDAEGRALYAAFCATSLVMARPDGPLLGQSAVIASALYEVSATQLGSVHHLHQAGVVIAELRMISTFVGRDESGSNHRILRRPPSRGLNLPPAPASLRALADQARQQARGPRDHDVAAPDALTLTPCPSLDFNAVGLLYFPTFSRLAEQAEWAASRPLAPLARRDVVYLGNLDRGENVSLRPGRPDPGAQTFDVLRGDARIIARVTTRRHPL